jgi:hypothetical protein
MKKRYGKKSHINKTKITVHELTYLIICLNNNNNNYYYYYYLLLLVLLFINFSTKRRVRTRCITRSQWTKITHSYV